MNRDRLASSRQANTKLSSCHCQNKTTIKSLLAQEMMSKQKRRTPGIIARLMGLDVLPPGGSSSKAHHPKRFKDVSEDLSHHQQANTNLTQAEMAFIKHKFMEAKRLSTDDKLRHSKQFNDTLEALDSNKDLLLKFLHHPDSLFEKHLRDLQTIPHKPHSRHVSCETFDLPDEELHPTKIVLLKPSLRYAATSSSDEFRADRRLPCRRKSKEDIRVSRHNSRDSKIMSRERKKSCSNTSAMTCKVRGYAGDESSSGSDSASESELVPVTSRTRTAFNRKNYHRSLPSNSATSSVSREAKRRLSERWKLTHKYEQEIEISRSGTLAEMLATSDREARPASFNGLVFEQGISKRFEDNVQWPELPEPVGISSRDGWKGSWTRRFSKCRTITNQQDTIVLPKGTCSRHGESFLSSKSRAGSSSSKPHSSYTSSPEVNMSPSLRKVHCMKEEKLSPLKARSSFSVDASSDSEDDGSASVMSSEAPDLSTVTPDILRRPAKEVNHSSVPEPQSLESSKEGDQPSPVSVLEASFNDNASSNSECFESVSADLQGLRMQLQLLKLESAAYDECDMLVSSDEDTDQDETFTITDKTMITEELREEDWRSLYLVDLLANSSFSDLDHNNVMETSVDPSLFEDLEKKYSSVKTSTRLERKFLFDQINRELIQILKQFSNPHPWVKPTRVCKKWDTNKIQETLRDIVTRKEEKPSKDDVEEQWLNLEDEIEIIGRNIEEMLTEELIAELVVGSVF